MNFFKTKLKPELIIQKREGRAPLMVAPEVHAIFENQKLNPTPSDSKMGMCVDGKCHNRYREKFLSSLMDLDTMSCFMRNHQIESFGGVMSADELVIWGDKVDYAAWVAGECEL